MYLKGDRHTHDLYIIKLDKLYIGNNLIGMCKKQPGLECNNMGGEYRVI